MTSKARLLLASRSPRRRELLTQIGVDYEVVDVDVDESHRPGEGPEAFVQRLAMDKARAGFAASRSNLPALGSDTIVVRDEDVLGKPAGREDAAAMLRSLAGRSHRVMTAVALVDDSRQAVRLNISQVTFRPLSEAEIMAYCKTAEPDDKAGAYAIQGLAAAFIVELQGSFSGVMGLPLFETAELLAEFEIRVL
jgi:septum formation protein